MKKGREEKLLELSKLCGEYIAFLRVKEILGSRTEEVKPKSKVTASKVFFRVVSAMLWLVVSVWCLFSVVSFFRGDEHINVMGFYPVHILTGSMEPSIGTGALIINKEPPPAESIDKDDVISFRLETRAHGTVIVTHRVVDWEYRDGSRVFRTQGDALARPDRFWVPYDDIIGVHSGVTVPYVGFGVAFYSSLHGIISMASCLLLYFIYCLIVDGMKKKEPEQGSKKEVENAINVLEGTIEFLGSQVKK